MLSFTALGVPELLGYWVHDWSPVLVEFSDRIAIRYYGLSYVLGFVIAWMIFEWARRKGRSPLQAGDLENLLTYLFLGVVIGGRLGSVILYHTDSLWRDPLYIFRVWEGGMASHGGFIGVTVAVLIFARRHRQDPFAIADLMAVAAPPGLLLGRFANFINGELWGKVSSVPWAVIFPDAQRPGHYDPDAFTVYSEELQQWANPRHPSQLYEAALEGIVLGLYLHWRFWRTPPGRLPAGQLAAEFFIAYGILRIVGELFREPDAGLILGVSRGIFYSILTIVGGIVLLRMAQHRSARSGITAGS